MLKLQRANKSEAHLWRDPVSTIATASHSVGQKEATHCFTRTSIDRRCGQESRDASRWSASRTLASIWWNPRAQAMSLEQAVFGRGVRRFSLSMNEEDEFLLGSNSSFGWSQTWTSQELHCWKGDSHQKIRAALLRRSPSTTDIRDPATQVCFHLHSKLLRSLNRVEDTWAHAFLWEEVAPDPLRRSPNHLPLARAPIDRRFVEDHDEGCGVVSVVGCSSQPE